MGRYAATQKRWYEANKEEIREKARLSMRARRAADPEKEKIITKRWSDKNHDYTRNYWLKRNYGITLKQMQELFAAQGNKCAICHSDLPQVKNRTWHVDHCHVTQKVRGILCQRCNIMLGHAKDSPEILIRAAEYIAKHVEK